MGAWLTAAPSRQPLYHSMSPVEAALQQTLDLRTFARRLCGQHCPPSGTPSGPRNLAFSLSPRVLSQSYAGPQYPGFCSHRVTPYRQHVRRGREGRGRPFVSKQCLSGTARQSAAACITTQPSFITISGICIWNLLHDNGGSPLTKLYSNYLVIRRAH